MNKRVFVLILTLFVVQFQLWSQKSGHWVKASMLYQLCTYIEWPANVQKDSKFTIGLLDADNEYYNELNVMALSNQTIHGKPLAVKYVTLAEIPKEINVLIIGDLQHKNAETILAYCKAHSILLVSDDMENNLHTVINFYYNKAKKAINFEVNKQNLIQSKLNYNDDILMYGGTLVDVKELYQQTNKQLEQEALKVKQISQQIKEQNDEIIAKNKQILLLNSDIKQSNALLTQMADSTEQLKTVVDSWKRELQQKQVALSSIENDYQQMISQKKLQESVMMDNEKTLQELDVEINEREKIISKQSIDINQKDSQLKNRDRILFISILFGLILAGIGVFYIYAFRTKNKYNKLLEIQVEERTAELRKSESDYREVFNGVSDFISIHDEKGRIITVNEPMLKAFGYANDEIGSLELELISDANSGYTKAKADELFQTALLTGQHSIDWLVKRKNGDVFWVIVTVRHAIIGGEPRLLTVMRDNDANKKNEIELGNYRNHLEVLVKEKTEELEASNEELKATNEELFDKNDIINHQNTDLIATLNKLKVTQVKLLQSEKMASLGILSAGVAHEINNPLNFIMGAYEGLKTLTIEAEKDQFDMFLNAIKIGVDRATSIVKSLNQFSRDNQSHNETCNIHEIIDNCLIMLQSNLSNRIEICKALSEKPLLMQGNVGSIHQVILNILSNAEQAIEGAGKININTLLNDDNLIVEIADNGCGIPPENLKRITDPFFTTKDPGKGTGLGLSITYNIVKEHGGYLEFESSMNHGTKVTLTFPINNKSLDADDNLLA